jgi:hypothetical protein
MQYFSLGFMRRVVRGVLQIHGHFFIIQVYPSPQHLSPLLYSWTLYIRSSVSINPILQLSIPSHHLQKFFLHAFSRFVIYLHSALVRRYHLLDQYRTVSLAFHAQTVVLSWPQFTYCDTQSSRSTIKAEAHHNPVYQKPEFFTDLYTNGIVPSYRYTLSIRLGHHPPSQDLKT